MSSNEEPDMPSTGPATAERIQAEFEIVEQSYDAYDTPEGAPALGRLTITKKYDGAIVGSGVAHVLIAGDESDGGYVASERVVGTLAGRSGSFVVQHSGHAEGGEQFASGRIVPGSGTDQLAGISGTAAEHRLGVLSLVVDLPDADHGSN